MNINDALVNIKNGLHLYNNKNDLEFYWNHGMICVIQYEYDELRTNLLEHNKFVSPEEFNRVYSNLDFIVVNK